MSGEFQFPPFLSIPVKTIPEAYPPPRCDPKKNIINLPPAAGKQELGVHPSVVYRDVGKVPRPPRQELHTSSEEEDEYEKAGSDRSSSVSPSAVPHVPPGAGWSAPPAANLSPAAAGRPHGRVHSVGPPAPRIYPVGQPAPRVPPAVRPPTQAGSQEPAVSPPNSQKTYSVPQIIHGSTIPRYPQNNTICSPAARMGRANPYGVNKTLRSPPRN